MDREFQEIEDALKSLRPHPGAGFERFAAAMEGHLQESDPALRPIEHELARLRPEMPLALSSTLLETLSRVPFPVDEKVVLFPGAPRTAVAAAATATPLRTARPRSWWAAAAAVAVAGAFSAMMIDGGSKRGQSVAQGNNPAMTGRATAPVSSPLPPSATAAGIVPASVGTSFHEATNEGVVWNEKGEPFRVVNVVYIDRVEIPGPDGRMMIVERPRVEKIMVPEKVD